MLRQLRSERQLTQEELGFRAGLQRKHISALELAQKQPSLSTLFALSKALDIRTSRFIALVELAWVDPNEIKQTSLS
ncbi:MULTISPECIES: helix-turn-helix domain-containing protein [Massilia]|uniref:Helix-turn-helix domain-containing protein n=1 Tax=Massilia consociata TaxID=760117 RepID=A0ABV6FLG2_9BURK|nr:helix-turn-helix transcriptional regulator [Massilia varians]